MVRPLWKITWWFLKKLKIQLIYDQGFPLLGIYLEELKAGSWGDMNTRVCSSFIQNSQEAEATKYLSMEGWINKMSGTYNEIWDNLQRRRFWHILHHGWTLRTRHQVKSDSHKRTNIIEFPLHRIPRVARFIETESRMWLPGTGGREKGREVI